MSYNPNQPYNAQAKRTAAGDAGPPYQTHAQYQQQNFAVPKANYNAPANQQAYVAADVRSAGNNPQYAPVRSNPAPSNQANEWDQFFAQAGSNVAGARGPQSVANQGYAAPQQQPYVQAASSRPNQQYAPQAAPVQQNYRGNAASNSYAQHEYDPSGLNSLKQTLAQTISSNNASVGAYQTDYNSYNSAPAAAPKQGYYNSNPASADHYDPRTASNAGGQSTRTQQPYVAEHGAPTANYNAYSASAPRAAQGPAGLVPGDVRYQPAQQHQQAPLSVSQQRGGYAGPGAASAQAAAPAGAYYNRRPAAGEPIGGVSVGATLPHKRDYNAMYDPSPQTAAPAQQYGNYNAPAAQGRPAYEATYQLQQQHQAHQQAHPAHHQQQPSRFQQTNAPSFSPPESPVQRPMSAGAQNAAFHAPAAQQVQQYAAPYNPAPAVRGADRDSSYSAARAPSSNPNLPYAGVGTAGNQPYDPHGAASNAYPAAAPAVQYLPQRQSKWSARLVDPLDIYDNLLANTVPAEELVADVRATEAQGRYTGRTVTSVPARDTYSSGGRHADEVKYGSAAASSSGSKRARRSPSRSPPRQRGTTAGGGSDRASAPSRKSESVHRSRSRSRSGSVSLNERRGGGDRATDRASFNPYGPSSGGVGSSGAAISAGVRISKPPLDYATAPTAALIQHYQLPAFAVQGASQLRALDLSARFPRLYLPNDFLSVHVDHGAIAQALNDDVFSNLINSVPHVLESNPSALLSAEHPSRINASATCDVLEPPKFTYNHTVPSQSLTSKAQFVSVSRPVKFQVKVLVCLGMSNADTDRIDHRLPQKLRFLCGRRKGSIMLLGCPWSAELDIDPAEHANGSTDAGRANSPLRNRSVLVRTAQRALYSQCLLRIPVDTTHDASGSAVHHSEGLVRLSEVHYHRPQEVIRGKVYPEQEEITTLFLYTVQPHLLAALSAEEMERNYRVFCRRQQGTDVGPRVNASLAQFDGEFADSADKADVLMALAVAVAVPVAATHTSVESAVATGDKAEESSNEAERKETEQPAEPRAIASAEGAEDAEGAKSAGAAAVTESPPADASNTTTEAPTKAAEVAAASVSAPLKAVPARPENSFTLLLCPMPLPEEVISDATRKAEGVSLRLLPMSSVLDYTQEDRSERLFETSLAAELVRSLLSVNFANLVTDFILAEHPVLHAVADARVIHACKKLRAMIAADKVKVIGANATTKTVAMSPAQAHPVPQDTSAVLAPAGAQTEPSAGGTVVPSDGSESDVELLEYTIDGKPGTAEEAAQGTDATVNSTADIADTAESHQVASSGEGNVAEATAREVVIQADGGATTVVSTSVGEEQQEDQQMDVQAEPQVEAEKEAATEAEPAAAELTMGEEEARLWRRRFVSAARWFDVSEVFLLHYDHLQMILNSSTRNLTRADVEDALDRVCRNDILRYETFI